MMTATNLKPTLATVNGKAAGTKGAKADVKDFGTHSAPVVSDALATRVTAAQRTYGNFAKSTKEWLPKLRTVGGALNELRELYKSDKEFGEFLAENYEKLASMPRQLRAELMTIDREWDLIESLREKGEITSYSTGVIVKQLRAFKKAQEEDKAAPKPAAGKSDAPTSTMAEEREAAEKTSPAKLSEVSEADYAQIIVDTAIKAGMDLGELMAQLKKLTK